MSPPPPPPAAPDRFKGCWRWRGQARPGCQISQFSQFSVLYWQTRAGRAGLHSSSRYCQTSLLSSLLSPLLPPPFYPPQHSQLGHLSDQRSEEEPLSSLCFPTRKISRAWQSSALTPGQSWARSLSLPARAGPAVGQPSPSPVSLSLTESQQKFCKYSYCLFVLDCWPTLPACLAH